MCRRGAKVTADESTLSVAVLEDGVNQIFARLIRNPKFYMMGEMTGLKGSATAFGPTVHPHTMSIR